MELRTVVVNHPLDVTHNLSVAAVRLLGHPVDVGAVAKHSRGLRVQHEGHGEEALDPF